MDRRQLLKATLTGAVAACVAPIALAWGKMDRGTAPVSAMPTTDMPPVDLLDAFRRFPNANYVLESGVWDCHFYPLPGAEEWFELYHFHPEIFLAQDTYTYPIIRVKFKPDADVYSGLAHMHGITRYEMKQRYFAEMYGARGDNMYLQGTHTGRLQCQSRIHRSNYAKPEIRVIDVKEPRGWDDFSKLEARVVAAIRQPD